MLVRNLLFILRNDKILIAIEITLLGVDICKGSTPKHWWWHR